MPHIKRLRVLHVGKFYPPYHGGIETHLYTLCNSLRGRVDLNVLVSNTAATTTRELIEGVQVTRAGTLATIASAPISPALVSHMRGSDWDLIHLHWPNPMAVLAYLAARPRGRLILTYHSDVVRQRLLRVVFAPFLETVLRKCAAIVIASPNHLSSSTVLERHKERCNVIPYGISQEYFGDPAPGEVRDIRARHGSRIILSVGRLVGYKGYEHLIRAMVSVPGRLLIAGSGPLRSQLIALAETLGLSERVVFLGNPSPEALRDYYHAAHLFVLASSNRSEAFGIVQAEAMAAGKPVVNTCLASGVPFVSLNGETGITVPPSDPAALAAAVNLLLDNEELRHAYGEAARRRAKSMFSAEAMARDTLKLYQQVVGVQTPSEISIPC